MKKITLYCLLLLLCSCNNGLNIERMANKQAHKTAKEFARNPESVKISDIETVFQSDSTCVLHFTLRGQNGFGGYTRQEVEYIYYLADSNRIYECFIDLEEKKSQYEKLKRSVRNSPLIQNDSTLWIQSGINIYAIMHGRQIKKDE